MVQSPSRETLIAHARHICLVVNKHETASHPVVSEVVDRLRVNHELRILDVRTLAPTEAIAREEREPPADLYLLKGHAPQALAVAQFVETRGAPVLNSWAATSACQDRERMASMMQEAGLPWPRTEVAPTLGALLDEARRVATLTFPLVSKSRCFHPGRWHLVNKIANLDELRAQQALWGEDSVVLQEYLPSDGWDIKLWVIGNAVFGARRRSRLCSDGHGADIPIAPDELPPRWRQLAIEAGRVFDLDVYGVDVLVTNRGPFVVDVNAFPGCRGVPGAPNALVSWIEGMLSETARSGSTV